MAYLLNIYISIIPPILDPLISRLKHSDRFNVRSKICELMNFYFNKKLLNRIESISRAFKIIVFVFPIPSLLTINWFHISSEKQNLCMHIV